MDIVLDPKAQRQLRRTPRRIIHKLREWVVAVGARGLREVAKTPGYHDEPLGGRARGHRSIRLSRLWRAIYRAASNRLTIRFVTPHDYRVVSGADVPALPFLNRLLGDPDKETDVNANTQREVVRALVQAGRKDLALSFVATATTMTTLWVTVKNLTFPGDKRAWLAQQLSRSRAKDGNIRIIEAKAEVSGKITVTLQASDDTEKTLYRAEQLVLEKIEQLVRSDGGDAGVDVVFQRFRQNRDVDMAVGAASQVGQIATRVVDKAVKPYLRGRRIRIGKPVEEKGGNTLVTINTSDEHRGVQYGGSVALYPSLRVYIAQHPRDSAVFALQIVAIFGAYRPEVKRVYGDGNITESKMVRAIQQVYVKYGLAPSYVD